MGSLNTNMVPWPRKLEEFLYSVSIRNSNPLKSVDIRFNSCSYVKYGPQSPMNMTQVKIDIPVTEISVLSVPFMNTCQFFNENSGKVR